MTNKYDWVSKAEAAEAVGDWHEAKKCWYYAARQYPNNDLELATYYGVREDAAGERIRQGTAP